MAAEENWLGAQTVSNGNTAPGAEEKECWTALRAEDQEENLCKRSATNIIFGFA